MKKGEGGCKKREVHKEGKDWWMDGQREIVLLKKKLILYLKF